MSQLDQQVARRLTRFYILALTVIAVLSISGLLFIRQTISNNYDDSRVVNVAGRQRMLSQRLTKQALLRASGLVSADNVPFDSLLRIWSQTHVQLRSGVLHMEKSYRVRRSPKLDSMFAHIDPYFQSMYRNLRLLNNPGTSAVQKNAALQTILRDEFPFLQQMNAIVFQFDTESFGRVKKLERIEWILTIATLLTLLVEGLFIFRPVVNHTRHVIYKLTRSENALQKANNRLEITNRELESTNQHLILANRQLVKTQAELLRTTEEKYQLQMAEANVRSAALLEGQEEERRRFARELHDGIGQMLTGLKLHAEKLKLVTGHDEKLRIRFTELCDLIYDTIQTTRQISHNLMPSTLGDFGLGPALSLLAEQTARSSGIDIIFVGNRDGERLSAPTEIGLYRIAQEALHNAVKYASAQSICIRLQRTDDKLTLSVEDDGKGFSIKTAPKQSVTSLIVNGLENMKTRARLLNGELTIVSKLKKGTTVSVCMNLADN